MSLSDKPVVFFDIDDTLVKGQSQQLFIKFLRQHGFMPLFLYIRLMFWFLLYRFHFIKNPKTIARYAFSFLKGLPRKKLEEIVEKFLDEVLTKRFYQDALLLIEEHKKHGRNVFVVSNAFDVLVEKVARYVGADDFIATKLEVKNGILTGEIDGIINYGDEKADRVREFCSAKQIPLNNSWGYADHVSDMKFLQMMKRPFFVNPTKKTLKVSKDDRFEILVFKK